MVSTVVHCVDSTEFGGAERALLHLIEQLDSECWHQVLLHPGHPGHNLLVEGARAAGAEVRALPATTGVKGLLGVSYVIKVLRDIKPSVFHAHLNWPLSCSIPIMAATLARVPARVATVQLFGSIPDGILLRMEAAAVVRCVHHYLAVSGDIKRRMVNELKVSPGRASVVYNPAPPSIDTRHTSEVRRSLGIPDDRPLVITLARLAAQKGLSYLLDAARELPDTYFVIAGEGDERTSLERQIADARLEERVRLPGFRADTSSLLAACDVFVLPSLYEGLPLSILEAMSHEKPVVATNIPGVDEVITHGKTGLLVPPASSAQLAAAIKLLLRDRAYAEQLAHAGARMCQAAFSTETMAAKVAGVYERVLKEQTSTVPSLHEHANRRNSRSGS